MRAPIKHALARTYENVLRNHTLQMGAALSYYFVLSLFPSLIFLSAIVAYLPVPNLFDQALGMMAQFLPPDSMGLVRRVLSDVITPSRGMFLSFGIVGTLWTASGGFAAAIEALNIAPEVHDDRPFWKTRPLAAGLALVNWRPDASSTVRDDRRAQIRRMARWPSPPVLLVCLAMALHSRVHSSRRGSFILPCSEC